MIISVPVHATDGERRPTNPALVAIGPLQVSVLGLYRYPVLKYWAPSRPPQTIISDPVQTATCPHRGEGAFVVETSVVQASVTGSYFLPSPESPPPKPTVPPQMIISEPVQTALAFSRPGGAPVSVVSVVQTSVWEMTGVMLTWSVSVRVLPERTADCSQGRSDETDQRSGV